MKKLTLFLVASVMLSSTFLSASCGDDDDEVKPEEIVDEWLSDKAVESNDFLTRSFSLSAKRREKHIFSRHNDKSLLDVLILWTDNCGSFLRPLPGNSRPFRRTRHCSPDYSIRPRSFQILL